MWFKIVLGYICQREHWTWTCVLTIIASYKMSFLFRFISPHSLWYFFLSTFNGFIEIIKNAYLNGSTMEKAMKHKPKSIEYWFLCLDDSEPTLYLSLFLCTIQIGITKRKLSGLWKCFIRFFSAYGAYDSVQMNRQIYDTWFHIKSNEICDSFDLNWHIEAYRTIFDLVTIVAA